MKEQLPTSKIVLIAILILAAALSRFIPHPSNFTAIGAMALFGGTMLSDKRLAFLLPMLVMLLTDAVLGFHESMIPVYACFAMTVWIGIKIKDVRNVLSITTASIISSTLFFVVTNLPFWYAGISLYPLTWAGTMASYTAAIPFFGNQLGGDLFYNAVIFGSFAIISRRLPVLSD